MRRYGGHKEDEQVKSEDGFRVHAQRHEVVKYEQHQRGSEANNDWQLIHVGGIRAEGQKNRCYGYAVVGAVE